MTTLEEIAAQEMQRAVRCDRWFSLLRVAPAGWAALNAEMEVLASAVRAHLRRTDAVVRVREVPGPPIDPPDDDRVGDYAPTPWMIWTISDTATLESVEGASFELLGYQPEELVGRSAAELMPAETIAGGVAMWVDLYEQAPGMATSRRPWLRLLLPLSAPPARVRAAARPAPGGRRQLGGAGRIAPRASCRVGPGGEDP